LALGIALPVGSVMVPVTVAVFTWPVSGITMKIRSPKTAKLCNLCGRSICIGSAPQLSALLDTISFHGAIAFEDADRSTLFDPILVGGCALHCARAARFTGCSSGIQTATLSSGSPGTGSRKGAAIREAQ